jgi:hypothetical protein
MRRGVGIGAIKNKVLQQAKFEQKAAELSENELVQLTKQMETFKKNLEEFAFKYKDEIKKNSSFRKQFQDMCANIGVDPLASSKGFWSEMLVGKDGFNFAVFNFSHNPSTYFSTKKTEKILSNWQKRKNTANLLKINLIFNKLGRRRFLL